MSAPTLAALYQEKVDARQITPDAAQMAALGLLEHVRGMLAGYRAADRAERRGVSALLKTIMGQGGDQPSAPIGLYVYGEVGRGKSMLMDLFFANVAVAAKRRVHFHQFMLEIHARLHALRDQHADDVLPRLARDLAEEISLLCFDEFHVSNIADAMILGRLFDALFKAGVYVVATSNWPPDMLYKNGLQRDRFLPFIAMLKARMEIYNLDGAVDHRYEQTRGTETCFHPLGIESTRRLQALFLNLTNEAEIAPLELPVQGRVLRVTQTAAGVGFFNFEELCGRALGAADYLAMAECLHTVLIDQVPVFKSEQRNETLRFITLIDTLYEAKVQLFMAAAAAPDQLCVEGELAFPFQRTLSRIMEMQGETYRRKAHLG